MGLKDIYEALKQTILIAETQKRQEEDIKELKQHMIKFSFELQRLSDRIDIVDGRSQSNWQHLAANTKLEMENLALRMQLLGKGKEPKSKPDENDEG
jgi:ABC-type phosphate transport system auxiliary subunit